jgi:serine/threonine-protein kinase
MEDSSLTIGCYQREQSLGGGIAEVYRAVNLDTRLPVVIKLLRRAHRDDPSCRARLVTEARLARRCHHPNVVAVLDSGDFEGRPYFVMEYLPEPALSFPARATGWTQVAPTILALCRALDHVHRQGVVHGDIKPANVRFNAAGVTKLCDFGLARDLAAPPSRPPAGTAPYLAPEQVEGATASVATDIWSFGVVLFELLAGKRPFAGRRLDDTLNAIVAAAPKWDLLPPHHAPPAMLNILHRCLEKDPRRRYHSMASILALLETLNPSA